MDRAEYVIVKLKLFIWKIFYQNLWFLYNLIIYNLTLIYDQHLSIVILSSQVYFLLFASKVRWKIPDDQN